ncbi:hypothetical protein D9C73_001510 [Collichthys lucidus]|uniref:Uncharacterized protein n=1 Tax=Collichthys lucidus TaxID=240159 RepID=A0A4U5TZM2_COLLU|nr:hypothetical protein D9C73_001510 [Collichthys lucidus]
MWRQHVSRRSALKSADASTLLSPLRSHQLRVLTASSPSNGYCIFVALSSHWSLVGNLASREERETSGSQIRVRCGICRSRRDLRLISTLRRQGRTLYPTVPENAEREAQSLFVQERTNYVNNNNVLLLKDNSDRSDGINSAVFTVEYCFGVHPKKQLLRKMHPTAFSMRRPVEGNKADTCFDRMTPALRVKDFRG